MGSGCEGYVDDRCRTRHYIMDAPRSLSPRSTAPKIILFGACITIFVILLVLITLMSPKRDDGNAAQMAGFGQDWILRSKETKDFDSTDKNLVESHPATSTRNVNQQAVCELRPHSNYTYDKNNIIYFQYWEESDRNLKTISSDSEILSRLHYQRKLQRANQNKTEQRGKTILTLSPLEGDENDLRKCSKNNMLEREYCNFTTDKNMFEIADAIIVRDQDFNSLPKESRTKQVENNHLPVYQLMSRSLAVRYYNVEEMQIRACQRDHHSFGLQSSDYQEFSGHIDMEELRKTMVEVPEKNYTDSTVRLVVYNKNCEDEKQFYNKYKNIIENFEENGGMIVEWFNYQNCSKYNLNITRENDCINQSSEDCYKKLGPLRKFALAFEISNVDYISERFFHPLNNFIIPIAIGSTLQKYSAVSPKNSFIYYCGFEEIDKLKEQLKVLNSNKDDLEKFFKWRAEGKFLPRSVWYCQVCFMLHRAARKGLAP